MISDKDIEKLTEVFATKQDIENLIEIVATKEDLKNFATTKDLERFATKEDFRGLLNGQDKIIGKLDMLLDERTVGNDQNKRQKKVLEIHHGALKAKGILSEKESLEVNKLQVF